MLGNSQKRCWEMSFSRMGYVAPWGRGFFAVTAFFCCVTAWREMLEDLRGSAEWAGEMKARSLAFQPPGISDGREGCVPGTARKRLAV